MLLKTEDIANRIKLFRKKLGLSRENFSELFSVSFSALRSWELGLVKHIQINSIEDLVKNIQQNGYDVTLEWFLYGEEKQSECPHNYLHTISNNDNSPAFQKGDLVVAEKNITVDLKKTDSQLCILFVKDRIHFGILKKTNQRFVLNNIYGSSILEIDESLVKASYRVTNFIKKLS